MKSGFTLVFSLVAATLPFAAAHGIVQDVKLDGQLLKGNRIEGPARDAAIRRVFSQDPIKGAKNRDINCGTGAISAKLVADAKPGSKLEFNWRAADGSPWPHNMGPVMTYMASCGDESCDKFDPINAKWFKIAQDGLKDNGKWFQEDIKNGAFSRPATIPNNLAAGNYMVRHEIIALHLANQMGGAEFYAGCLQLKLSGSGTGAPSSDELVSLPGAYKDNDPGIFVPNIFNGDFKKYDFPGPAVTKLAAKADGNKGGNGGSDSGKCKLKSGNKNNAAQENMQYQPRHISRVMRDIKFH